MRRDTAPNPLIDPAFAGTSTGWRVQAPGRLHLGFLDPSATLGRRFGSLGLVVEGFESIVDLRPARHDEASASGPEEEAELPRALAHLQALREASGRREPVHLHIAQVLPAHAGFGSGTQLALAVGHAFCRLHELRWGSSELAHLLGRGQRSGVGIAGFDRGGLLLDGGPRADGTPAPLISRLALPPQWRVLLVLDRRLRGLSGADEKKALQQLAPLPREAAAEVCHEVLMRVLPGAATGEFDAFATGLTRMQAILGGHFAPAQHGSAFASAAVRRAIESVAAHTPAAVGQSSWGPTGFAVLPSSAAADAALAQARADGAVDPALAVHVVRSRDHGASVTALAPTP